jgi:hypothetical protein
MTSYSATLLSDLNQKSTYISQHILNEFPFPFYIFLVIGIIQLNWTNKKLTLFLLTVFFTVLLTNFFYLQVSPIEFWHLDDHLLATNWLLGLFIGVGLYSAISEASTLRRNITIISQIILLTICLLLIPITFLQNYFINTQKDRFLYYGYGLTALKSMPKNTVYFAESDYDCFSTLYLKTVLNKRPDIHLLLTFMLDKPYARELISKTDPILLPSTASNSLLTDLIHNNYKSHPIYCTFSNVGFADLYLKNFKNMLLVPSGIMTHIIQHGELVPYKALYEPLKSFWDEYLQPEMESPSFTQGILRQACASPYLNAAQYEKFHGHLEHWDWYYSKAIDLIPDPSWLAQTWVNKAEGDILMGKTIEAGNSYRLAGYYFYQLGQFEKANSVLGKSKAVLAAN